MNAAELLIEEIPLRALPRDAAAWLHAFADLPGLVFLDSARPSGPLGRYSFLCADPIHRLEAKNGRVTLDGCSLAGDPFQAAHDLSARYPVTARSDLPPFQTGLAGFFGYDLRHHLEDLPPHAADDQPFPDMSLGLYDVVIAFDHELQRCVVMASGYPETGAARVLRARARLDAMVARLRQ
ncbi:MAG: aminodeoxychorismate synthase, component I, partial [Dongiaceae bacterium]